VITEVSEKKKIKRKTFDNTTRTIYIDIVARFFLFVIVLKKLL